MSRNNPTNLLDILHEAVVHAPNGRKAQVIAELIGRPYATLMLELNSGNDTNKFDARLVLALMIATGSMEPLHWLAGMTNHVCIQLPKVTPSCENSSCEALKATQEFGEMIGEYNKAVEDGRIRPGERRDIKREAYEAVAAILRFAESLPEEG